MNDKKKKKEYVVPKVEIVNFTEEDIITASGDLWGDGATDNLERW